MQIESKTLINRPVQDVFDYIARAEYLPEYVQDFESVRQTSEGEPELGTQYSYKMRRGAQGTFEWTQFERPAQLAWEGPPVKVGLGSMQPAGRWEITEAGDGTNVMLVMAPTPGGLFKLLAPLMTAGMRKGNDAALARLKDRLEQGGSEPGAAPPGGSDPGAAPPGGSEPGGTRPA